MSEDKKDILEITAPRIPSEYGEFANKVADLADEYGFDKFVMTYRPNFDYRSSGEYDHRIHGEMKIVYSSVDGRGRPDRNLQIQCESSLSIQIKKQSQRTDSSEVTDDE